MLRYSLRALLAFTLLAAIGAAILRPHRSPAAQVRAILNDGKSDPEKLRALSGFVRLGDHIDSINQGLGTLPDIDGEGVGFLDCYYSECGLQVCCYPDGIVYAIGYYPHKNSNPSFRWISHPGIVGWPRLSETAK